MSEIDTGSIVREVIRDEVYGLEQLVKALYSNSALETETIRAVSMCIRPGRLVCAGIGKSGHIARKIASSFCATGTPAVFVHPAEAGHGDLGAIESDDTLIVFSKSGRSVELKWLIERALDLKTPIIAVTFGAPTWANVCLKLPHAQEADEITEAPTTSAVMQLAMGDGLVIATARAKGFTREMARALHPAGSILKT